MIFKSNRQLWLTHDGEREKCNFLFCQRSSASVSERRTRASPSAASVKLLSCKTVRRSRFHGTAFFRRTISQDFKPGALPHPRFYSKSCVSGRTATSQFTSSLPERARTFTLLSKHCSPMSRAETRTASTTKSSSRSTGRSRSGRSKLILLGRRPSLRARPGQITAFRQNLHGKARRLPLQHLENGPRRRRPVQRNLCTEQG